MPIVDDSVVEAVETLSVNLLPIMESVIVPSDRAQATIEIMDNDRMYQYRQIHQHLLLLDA